MGLLKSRAPARAALVLVTALLAPGAIMGQSLGASRAPGGAELPDWLTRWSPIGLTGDLPRELPGHALAVPSVLTVPAPRTGAFWTAGNPAGLPWDVRDSYAQFRLAAKEDDGAYRRPLDPGSDSRLAGSAFAWKDLGGSGAVIGRVHVDRLKHLGGAFADQVLPHSSNPFVMLDTLGDEVSALVARLEGAGGWRVGNLGIGLGLGFDGREVRTVASPVPIQNRVSAAGVTGGLNYELFGGLVQVGAYGRWEQLEQTAAVTAFAQETRVLVLRGYFDPNVIDLGGGNSRTYARKLARNAHAFGTSLAGTVRSVAWAVYAQRNGLSERQSVGLFAIDPPTDDWDADGWTSGLSAQVDLADGRVLATLSGHYRTLTGSAKRMDLEGPHYTVNQNDWQVAAEVRLMPSRGWTGVIRLSTGRENWRARDSLARLGSDLKAWMPAAAFEVARALPARFTVAVGAGWAQHAPWGRIPDPSTLSAGYQNWIAPELTLYATKAVTVTGSATLLWRTRSGLEIWARGTLASLSGTRPLTLPTSLEGSRERSALTLGITMREP